MLEADARALLASRPTAAPFDVVFVDPPFAAGDAGQLCTLIADNGWLAPGGRLYLEQPVDAADAVPDGLECLRQKTAGAVRFAVYATADEGEQ